MVSNNAIGLEGGFAAVWSNNLAYNNGAGLLLHNGTQAQILNNTVYEPVGDALVLRADGHAQETFVQLVAVGRIGIRAEQ